MLGDIDDTDRTADLSPGWDEAVARHLPMPNSDANRVVERAGDAIGPYHLISVLGERGFGTVWLAERRHPFVQRLALKLVHLGLNSKQVVARFEQERQALAVMNHPNIVHRDLKPSNVLVTRGEENKLHAIVINFGVAKALSH